MGLFSVEYTLPFSFARSHSKIACASYWTFGPSITYATSAAAMVALYVAMKSIAQIESTRESTKITAKVSS